MFLCLVSKLVPQAHKLAFSFFYLCRMDALSQGVVKTNMVVVFFCFLKDNMLVVVLCICIQSLTEWKFETTSKIYRGIVFLFLS